MSAVAEICRDLIRIDTSNPGRQERPAAEYVATALSDAGYECTVVESAPGRTSVVTRLEGADSSRGALLVHGHLDVVPAEASDWKIHPFAGEVEDGCVWGRGAVDMKDMVAMTLKTAIDFKRGGVVPPRDLIFCFLADEEAGGIYGSKWIVREHPGLFEGATEAISEVGGFSLQVHDDLRLYLIETAQKGMRWMRITAAGRAGHGSMINDDNAVTTLCEAVARLGTTRFPVHLTPTVRRFLAEISDALGIEVDYDDLDATIAKLGPLARIIGATIRNTANPTMLEAGYKVNVIPSEAYARVDGRTLPGFAEEFDAELRAVLGPDIAIEVEHQDIELETEFEGDLVEAMGAALKAEDPGARIVPYMLSGGTDNKAFFDVLDIRGFGFSPLRLRPDLDFAGMFHGVDERVPIDALEFGNRVLDRFLRTC
ncbi:MAG TPA: M20/M25/M40 family metallo-hydrolase [Frankiaceae bacterium]|nr:M20/M25/M40 family metallo-hydrolase [Frankiaceae bacterium]